MNDWKTTHWCNVNMSSHSMKYAAAQVSTRSQFKSCGSKLFSCRHTAYFAVILSHGHLSLICRHCDKGFLFLRIAHFLAWYDKNVRNWLGVLTCKLINQSLIKQNKERYTVHKHIPILTSARSATWAYRWLWSLAPERCPAHQVGRTSLKSTPSPAVDYSASYSCDTWSHQTILN